MPKNNTTKTSTRYQRLKTATAVAEFKASLEKAEKQLDTDLQKIYEDALKEVKKMQKENSKKRLEKLKKGKK